MIQSDASLSGWGAVCKGVSTGGLWSPQEQSLHINCLELLAAGLALKSFLKDQKGVTVLDNSTAVAYINNLGGDDFPSTHSSEKRSVALDSGDISLTAQHIPWVSDTVADWESRMERGWTGCGSSGVPENQQYTTASGDRPVCFKTDFPAAAVLQLEAGPPSSSSGCLSTGLEPVERICQLPMVPGGMGTEQGGV